MYPRRLFVLAETCSDRVRQVQTSFGDRGWVKGNLLTYVPPLVNDKDALEAIRAVTEALASVLWLRQFDLICWLSAAVNRLLSFGGACWCHMADLLRGLRVTCWRKGRVLAYCYEWASQRLRELLEEANGWTERTWGGTTQFLHDAQGCVRATYAHGLQRIRVFDRLPYLFARLGEPGVRDRIRSQYEEVASHLHAGATLDIMEDPSLRADFEAMHADGTGMSAALLIEEH